MSVPLATAIVPVRDGAAHLPDLLSALRGQDLPGGLEILALDSASTDGSRAILESHGARIVEVPPGAFDHGETRNLGAREARGEHLLFLSQDALPVGAGFARALVTALERDGRVAGAFARQIPRPDADPLTRRDLASWVAAAEEPRTVFLAEVAGFDDLPPFERYRLSVFDDVASAVRRGTLLANPFRPARFGEDIEWGHRMLRLGHGLSYVPEAAVLHSHRRSARALYRRNYLGHRVFSRLFGLRTVPDVPHLLRACAGALASDLATLAREGADLATWLSAPVQAVAATYGQYRGARDEALGRAYPGWA